MKITFLFILMMSLCQQLMAAADYSVREGKLHRGGSARVEILPHPEDFIVKLNYHIKKKPLVPVPDDALKGETITELPEQFRDERGYLELAEKGTMEVHKATLKYLGKARVGRYDDGLKFEILPHNGKSRTEVIYHRSLPETGWWNIKIRFISNIPLLNGYEVILDMK